MQSGVWLLNPSRVLCILAVALSIALFGLIPISAQQRGTPHGEWHYQAGDAWGTRYSALDQIHAGNFEDLEVAWIVRGDNFGQSPMPQSRSTPSYIDGILYTVGGRAAHGGGDGSDDRGDPVDLP